MTPCSNKLKKLTDSRLIMVFFTLTAIVSTVVGIRHSISSDFDFQWAGAYLLAHGVDPWVEALESHRDLTNSPGVPNYLHELYVIYLPLAFLSRKAAGVAWCILNICFSILSVHLLGRIYRIDPKHQVLLFLLTASSVSLRAGIGAGQVCFAVLFLFCMVYALADSAMIPGICLGLSFAKYSFTPVIGLTFLLKQRFLVLLLAMLPVAVGLGACMWILHKPVYPLAFEPLLVARHGVSPGFADIMTLNERLRGSIFATFNYPIVLAIAFLYALRLALRARLSAGAELACVTVASLLLMKHLIYDYVLLIVPLAYALWGKTLRPWAQWTVVVIVGYIWFASPLYIAREPFRRALPLLVFNCACMGVLLFATDLGELRARPD